MEALGLARANATGAAASGSGVGSASTSASGSGTGVGAGDAGEDAAAGLGVDEVDPQSGTVAGTGAGRDGSRHTNMQHLPGNALNMVEMFQLRERNHILAQKSARRSGDRRSVQLDAVGLELFREIQREVERAHFSQAATSTRGRPTDASAERFTGMMPDSIKPRRDEPRLNLRHEEAPLTDQEAPPLDSDPDRPMASAAREHAAFQRQVLLDRCADAHAMALSDLAELNQAEGRTDELRARQAQRRHDESPQQDSADELRADGAEQFEAVARQRFAASNAKAVQLASAVQGRRIGLNRMLRDKAPGAPR
ncbi:hypothetical protein [Variovorax sp. WDL1]|uniref:hypothetical protein n=2 Tax=Variovorax TaxID=34072 RepID=UPI0008390A1C|nr:hypothetical protein [Variovorax sp. WDL1]